MRMDHALAERVQRCVRILGGKEPTGPDVRMLFRRNETGSGSAGST
jgi:hypothetical protein